MITKTFLKNAYEKGLVRLMLSPNMDGIVCAIGENWFYFGGETAEEYDTVEAYKQDIPKETFLDEIYRTLEDFREDSTFADEYAYYDLFLSEWGFRDKPMEEMSVQEFVLAYPTLADFRYSGRTGQSQLPGRPCYLYSRSGRTGRDCGGLLRKGDFRFGCQVQNSAGLQRQFLGLLLAHRRRSDEGSSEGQESRCCSTHGCGGKQRRWRKL